MKHRGGSPLWRTSASHSQQHRENHADPHLLSSTGVEHGVPPPDKQLQFSSLVSTPTSTQFSGSQKEVKSYADNDKDILIEGSTMSVSRTGSHGKYEDFKYRLVREGDKLYVELVGGGDHSSEIRLRVFADSHVKVKMESKRGPSISVYGVDGVATHGKTKRVAWKFRPLRTSETIELQTEQLQVLGKHLQALLSMAMATSPLPALSTCTLRKQGSLRPRLTCWPEKLCSLTEDWKRNATKQAVCTPNATTDGGMAKAWTDFKTDLDGKVQRLCDTEKLSEHGLFEITSSLELAQRVTERHTRIVTEGSSEVAKAMVDAKQWIQKKIAVLARKIDAQPDAGPGSKCRLPHNLAEIWEDSETAEDPRRLLEQLRAFDKECPALQLSGMMEARDTSVSLLDVGKDSSVANASEDTQCLQSQHQGMQSTSSDPTFLAAFGGFLGLFFIITAVMAAAGFVAYIVSYFFISQIIGRLVCAAKYGAATPRAERKQLACRAAFNEKAHIGGIVVGVGVGIIMGGPLGVALVSGAPVSAVFLTPSFPAILESVGVPAFTAAFAAPVTATGLAGPAGIVGSWIGVDGVAHWLRSIWRKNRERRFETWARNTLEKLERLRAEFAEMCPDSGWTVEMFKMSERHWYFNEARGIKQWHFPDECNDAPHPPPSAPPAFNPDHAEHK